MKKYKFCNMQTEEAIGTCNAQSKEAAILVFSDKKKLPVEEFLKIYRVMKA